MPKVVAEVRRGLRPLVLNLWTSGRIVRHPTLSNGARMSEGFQPISILSETECWNLLSSVALGRLVTSVDGEPAIFPVNFVVQHRTVLFRTAEGHQAGQRCN